MRRGGNIHECAFSPDDFGLVDPTHALHRRSALWTDDLDFVFCMQQDDQYLKG